MVVRSLVFDVGDEVCGWGRLVRTVEGDWFDPPLPVPLIGWSSGPPAPRPSHMAVRVEAADFDAVQQRYERDGAVEGYAMVYGVWLGDRIWIRRQTPQHADPEPPRWVDPPCPPPEGGWPHGMNGRFVDNLDFDIGDLLETGAAVAAVTYRPGSDQAVLVVAAADPDAVELHLRPQLSDRLCIVPSRWTRPAIREVRDHLHARWGAWGIFGFGEHVDELAQVTVYVELTRVTTEIAQWAESLPTDLVDLRPWLAPVRLPPAG